jgi:alpha,alpha-trehalose-phosphate synthase [UDP-forming]
LRPKTIVIANRLPERWVDGEWQPSPGGLVSSLTPILRHEGGVWIGWSGVAGETTEPATHEGMHLVPVTLSELEVTQYYLGFSNATIWPLYHDAIRTPEFHRTWWRSYQTVNRRFADAAVGVAEPGDLVWVHDYHLQLVPALVRALVPALRVAFYLHIPFPPVEIYARNPWRRHLLEGMLGADLVGFQTRLAADNFRSAALQFADAVIDGESLRHPGGTTRVIAAPISIDVGDFESLAASEATAERTGALRRQLGGPNTVILGVDRLDYTKGIDVRLRAFETFLERTPERAADTTFIQVASPSRETLSDYEEMKETVERTVGRINGTYGRHHRAPLHYIYESLPRDELVAYYAAADIMCVTPLRDGLNLIAKEYVVSHGDDGVLILSEFAGVANELGSAILVNPYDIDGMADGLQLALDLPPDERRTRMREMKEQVKSSDVHHWVARVLDALPRAR